MARVTVEDCVDKVNNRFDLILLAAHRARELSVGAPATLDTNDEKMPVVALRELATENIKADDLELSLVRDMQSFVEREETTPPVTAIAEQEVQTKTTDTPALPALEAIFEDANTSDIED